jgi:hypothetical protein
VGELWLPWHEILDDAGLELRETATNAGWETRSRSTGGFDAMPLGVMWHHAASARGADSEGIVNYQVRGNPDAPVGNLTLDRDGAVWPVAAGASNCSGKGGPWQMSRGVVPLDKGNTTLVNVETCNDGVGEPWPAPMVDGYMTLTLALNAWCGNAADDVTTHNAYAPTRKIDPATADAVQGPWRPASSTTSGTWELADITAELGARAKPAPIPAPPGKDTDMLHVVVYNADGTAARGPALVGPGYWHYARNDNQAAVWQKVYGNPLVLDNEYDFDTLMHTAALEPDDGSVLGPGG